MGSPGRVRGSKRVCWLVTIAAALLACGAAVALGPASRHLPAAGYEYFQIGDPAAPTPADTSPGLLLMGGGRGVVDAFRWFLAKAGHGHVVVLGASGADEWQRWIHDKVGGAASVQTLVFHSREAAGDARVLDVVRRADAIFIAGGDQANYVRFWRGTPLGVLLNEHVKAGKPLGGTSAGLAILGEWGYGAMDGGSVTSRQSLRDPAGPALTLVGDFMDVPLLAGVITDSHFHDRDRLGRLLAFVARVARDDDTAGIIGLGVDEDSALLVEGDGGARFVSWHPGAHAWVVVPGGLREVEDTAGRNALAAYLRGRVAPGRRLDLSGFEVLGVGTGSRLQLPAGTVTDPAFRQRIDVADGQLVRHRVQGQVPGG